jgi:hypothetical protein
MDDVAVAEGHGVALSARLDRRRLGRHVDPRAELLGLDLGALGELGAGDARREAEVVLDPRRRARLAAGGDALQRDRGQTLRRAVDARGEPGRPGSDDVAVDVPSTGCSIPRLRASS